jgi:hypothetical protein
MKEFDIFINNKIYPNAESIFNTTNASLIELKDDCIFVIDTNALLLPYTTSSRSLEEINKVFTKLKSQGRLIIPGQVAREFANNRPEKLKEIFQKLSRKRNEIQSLSLGKYPLLDGIAEYKSLLEIEEKINDLLNGYRKNISTVVETVKEWNWNDPVSKIYKELFTADTILDIEINEAKIKTELQTRYLHKIPPGYKDDNKPDDGIGDLLIWLTILEIGKSSKNVIFVSGDEKSDWYYRSEKQALYPRFELSNEFKINSNNKEFNIIKLFELLNLFGADDNVIKEVEIEEKISSSRGSDKYRTMEFAKHAELAVFDWLMNTMDDVGIVLNHYGFPDIEIQHPDNTNSGAEVIIVSHGKGLVMMRLRERLMRAYYEVNEGKFKTFMFFIIIPELSITKDILSSIEKTILDFNSSAGTFIYYIGNVDEDGKFSLLSRS